MKHLFYWTNGKNPYRFGKVFKSRNFFLRGKLIVANGKNIKVIQEEHTSITKKLRNPNGLFLKSFKI